MKVYLAIIVFLLVFGLLVFLVSCAGSSSSGLGQPIIEVYPTSISVSAWEGDVLPPYILEIKNKGDAVLNWTIESTVEWLSTNPQNGTINPSSVRYIRVLFDTSKLMSGDYTANLNISGAMAVFSLSISVSLKIEKFVGPSISLSKTSLTFSANISDTNPPAQTLDISNIGSGKLEFSAFSNANWLSVIPVSGVAPASLSIYCNKAGLDVGEYYGFVTVWCANARNPTRQIDVKLTLSSTSPPATGRKWTILVYMNADNSLEEYALEDINEMENVDYTSDVSVLVQIDRHKDYDANHGATNGNWTTARRYLIKKDTDPKSYKLGTSC